MDTVADMLTIIRNGQAAHKDTVKILYSNLKFNLIKLFKEKEYIENYEKKGTSKKVIIVTLKYNEDGTPFINKLIKVSKPGRRIYIKANEIRKVRGGYGRAILSTPK